MAGQARVHYGDEYRDLSVNESTYHEKEVAHTLENLGCVPLKLIEAQVGSYLGEYDSGSVMFMEETEAKTMVITLSRGGISDRV
jgi:mannose-6-phosphate isomerase-like protein (cupin superfamily)